MRKTKSLEERFFEKVQKTESCWIWTAYKTENGYGQIFNKMGNGLNLAHRLSWHIHNGEIPPETYVLHKCDNRGCVNPDHLFLGSLSDNMQDCAKKGRLSVVGKSKLTHCPNGHPLTPENTIVGRNPKHRRCVTCMNAALARKNEAAREKRSKTAKERFHDLGGDTENSPIERLRFFCSLAMNGKDWIDAELFIDDCAAAIRNQK